jgi:hypothetical protein
LIGETANPVNQSNTTLGVSNAGDRKSQIKAALEPVLAIRHSREGLRSSADVVVAVRTFASAVSRLGPVFSQLLRHFGSRPDCFSPVHCLILADTGLPWLLSPEELEPHFKDIDNSGSGFDGLYGDRERSDHLTQVYRWRERPEIVFRLLNPEFIAHWKVDRDLLEQIIEPAEVIWPKVGVERVVRQFKGEVEKTFEQRPELDWAQARRETGREFPAPGIGFVPPELAKEFCNGGIIAMKESVLSLELIPLVENENESASAAATADGSELGRRFSLSVFYHLCRGAWYPRSPSRGNVGGATEAGLSLLGGSVESLDPKTQDRLFQYFSAVVSNRPDEAAELLLALFEKTERGAASFERVRELFRQIVPFRDGGMGDHSKIESFSDYVFIQWRIATESGYQAPANLTPVIQCFWDASLLARNIDPSRDLLRDAYYEFRWIDTIFKLQESLTIDNIVQQGQDWFHLFVELREKLKTSARRADQEADSPTKKAPAPLPWFSILGHLFVMSSIGVFLVKLSQANVGGTGLLTLGIGAIAAAGLSLIGVFRRKR